MPKGRTPRRGRKRGRRPATAPVAPQTARVVAAPVAVTPPGETDSPHQRTGRAITRDYSYVQRDLRRLILLSAIILITIVFLSFFVP